MGFGADFGGTDGLQLRDTGAETGWDLGAKPSEAGNQHVKGVVIIMLIITCYAHRT